MPDMFKNGSQKKPSQFNAVGLVFRSALPEELEWETRAEDLALSLDAIKRCLSNMLVALDRDTPQTNKGLALPTKSLTQESIIHQQCNHFPHHGEQMEKHKDTLDKTSCCYHGIEFVSYSPSLSGSAYRPCTPAHNLDLHNLIHDRICSLTIQPVDVMMIPCFCHADFFLYTGMFKLEIKNRQNIKLGFFTMKCI